MNRHARRCLSNAKELRDLGCVLIPLRSKSKKPAIKDWPNQASRNVGDIEDWFRHHGNANYGVVTGKPSGIFVLDIDGPNGERSLKYLTAKHGVLPLTLTVKTPHGQHLYFRMAEDRVPNSAGSLGDGIDIRGDGGYVVGPGSVLEAGMEYSVEWDRTVAKAPTWLRRLVGKRGSAGPIQYGELRLSDELRARATKYAQAALEREAERVAKAPLHQRNNTLNMAAYKLGRLQPYEIVDRSTVIAKLTEAARVCGLGDAEISRTIRSGLDAGARRPRTLPFSGAPKVATSPALPRDSASIAASLAQLGETDTDNARRLVARCGGKLAWAVGTGWLTFDGKRWRRDQEGRRLRFAVKTAERIRDEARHLHGPTAKAGRTKFSEGSKGKGALDRMLECARPLVVVRDDALDANPFQLNVLNGTIDLKTGELLPHNAGDLITKVVRVEFDSDAECPRFKTFLRKVAPDPQLRPWLQRAVGYSLTGSARELVVFFLHGPGSTGKSTFVNLFRDLLGEYGVHTPTETLVAKHYDNAIPADLARMKGARMVTVVEANFNKPLDEAKLKGMTGGDVITARHLRQDFFEYKPEFKLWIAANDFPRVRATDDAIWNRLRVIPFRQVLRKSEIRRDLSERLMEEAPGILAWAVRGARRWYQKGLGDLPGGGADATAEWRATVNPVKRFFDEECRAEPDASVRSQVLFDRYRVWCGKNGERHASSSAFKARLVELDVTYKRTKIGSVWRGIKLIGE